MTLIAVLGRHDDDGAVDAVAVTSERLLVATPRGVTMFQITNDRTGELVQHETHQQTPGRSVAVEVLNRWRLVGAEHPL